MEPIKIRILKRPSTDEDTDSRIPYKKRIKQRMEKENETNELRSTSQCIQSKGVGKVLENSPVPTTRLNARMSAKKQQLSFDEVDDVFDEVLEEFSKSGIKLRDSNKKSTNSSTEKHKTSSSKTNKLQSPAAVTNQNKSKKSLLKDFEQSTAAVKKDNKSSSGRKISDFEKIPEDLILNYKRTPKKIIDLNLFESPEKEDSVFIPRRSSRRRSLLNEAVILEAEKTPVRKKTRESSDNENTPLSKFKRTPQGKSSSAKKLEVVEPHTPKTKINISLPTTPLEKARLSLHVSTVPECLPCREREYENIYTFLENKLLDCIGGCMYISGVPGTGKTATVTQVIRHLRERAVEGKLPEFKYIEINGMRLSNPRQAYIQLWQKLFDKKDKITADRAQRLLDEWFSKKDLQKTRKTTVLLVDELDLICTKKQDVVYNLLDWPTRTHSRLVVLTIANTMDMPERLFKGRVTSRMGLTRLTFMPYTHKQLEEIVLARLKGLNAFVTDAVRLVTRKVAAVSGDARRALDICRRATELPVPDESVKISHIEQAIKEMTNSNIVKVIRNCGEMEKLFLRSIADVSSRSNVEEVDLREVIDQLYAICVLEGITRPTISSVLSVSNRLKCCRLIFSNQSTAGILQRLTLNVTQDDIHYALRTLE